FSPGTTDPVLMELIFRTIVRPLVAELRRCRIDYRGILYFGLMLTADGPKVLEINVRFGDPEAQVVLLRLTCDLGELLYQIAKGDLRMEVTTSDQVAVGVVPTADG